MDEISCYFLNYPEMLRIHQLNVFLIKIKVELSKISVKKWKTFYFVFGREKEKKRKEKNVCKFFLVIGREEKEEKNVSKFCKLIGRKEEEKKEKCPTTFPRKTNFNLLIGGEG